MQEAYVKAPTTGGGDYFGKALALSGDGNILAVTVGEDSNATGIGGDPNNNRAVDAGAVYLYWGSGFSYSIGGTVAGLTGAGLVLQNNRGDNLSIGADGAFTFATPIHDSGAYSVTVSTQPVGQTCTVVNGTGTVAGANVNQVALRCVTSPSSGGVPTLTLDYGLKQLKFTWDAVNGATYYQLFENPDGVSGYTQVGGDLTATAYAHDIALHRRVNARYLLKACNNAGCTSSSEVLMSAELTSAIGYIKASNTAARDAFGISVALSGDGNTLAVGAPGESSNATGIGGDENDNSVWGAGAVYVYTHNGGLWAQQAYIKASNTEAGDGFGSSPFGLAVALSDDGNTLAVGARGEASNATGINGNQNDNSAYGAGAVYVYNRSGGIWTQQAYIKASNTEVGDSFGFSLAVSGDGNTLAVGASGEGSSATGIQGNESDNSSAGAGAVYVYTRSGGTWTQQAYVKASNTEAFDSFGWSVALSGDGNTLAVGAVFEAGNATGIGGNQNDESAMGAGAVYVYIRSASAWTQQAYVKASNTEPDDRFGSSLALSGDGNTLAVGAIGEDSNAIGIDGNQNDNSAPGDAIGRFPGGAGAVYVYTRSGSAWTQQAYVKASNTGPGDWFGDSVALSDDGNTLAVGAPYEASGAIGIGGDQNDNSAVEAGAVYVYTRSGGTWAPQSYVKASNTGEKDFFGHSVALSGEGDILAVGARYEDSKATGIGGDQSDNGAVDAGAVYLY